MKKKKKKSLHNFVDSITNKFPGIKDINDANFIEVIERTAIPLKRLLSNPDINGGIEYDGSVGGKHGDDPKVRKIASYIYNAKILNYYIKQIDSIEYNPSNLKKLEIKKTEEKGKPILTIRDEKEPGYAIKIEFHTKDSWYVFLLSKILSCAVTRFKEYPLSIKQIE